MHTRSEEAVRYGEVTSIAVELKMILASWEGNGTTLCQLAVRRAMYTEAEVELIGDIDELA